MSAQHTPSPWNPRPGMVSAEHQKDYHAGYSDGFHGAYFGAGHTEQPADYRRGYNDGRSDAAIAKARGAQS